MSVVVRGGLGLALVVTPGRVVRLTSGCAASPAQVWVARLLGARRLVEVAALSARPQLRDPVRWIDLLHAASMVGLAATSRAQRRPALASTAAAVALALSASAHARHDERQRRLPR